MLFDCHAKILDKMKPIGHLQRLGGTLPQSPSIKATTIPIDDFNGGMAPQPIRATFHAAFLQDVCDTTPLAIDIDRSDLRRFPPAPVIDPDDPCWWNIGSDIPLRVAHDGVIADPNAQPAQEALCWPPPEQRYFHPTPGCWRHDASLAHADTIALEEYRIFVVGLFKFEGLGSGQDY